MNKIHSDYLDSETLDNFKEIHHKLIPKRNKWFNIKSINSRNIRDNNTDIIQPILNKALCILREQNFKENIDYNPNQYHIEFQQRNCSNEKKLINKSWFDWHYDDYGAVSYKTYSIIFYIRKDKTVSGGNLEYKSNGKKHEFLVSESKYIMFPGNLYHNPQPSSGFGCRDTIVVFIKRN